MFVQFRNTLLNLDNLVTFSKRTSKRAAETVGLPVMDLAGREIEPQTVDTFIITAEVTTKEVLLVFESDSEEERDARFSALVQTLDKMERQKLSIES